MPQFSRILSFVAAAVLACLAAAPAASEDAAPPAPQAKAPVLGPALSFQALAVPNKDNAAWFRQIEEFQLGEGDAGIRVRVGNSDAYVLVTHVDKQLERKNAKTGKKETVTVKVPTLQGWANTASQESDGKSYFDFQYFGQAGKLKLPKGVAALCTGDELAFTANGVTLGWFGVVADPKGGAKALKIYHCQVETKKPAEPSGR